MSNMLQEIKYLPELILDQIPNVDNQVREIFNHREMLSIKEIIFTGCGDSYFAGLGASHFFQRVCNISSRSLQSLEASRYELIDYHSSFPLNPLVVATSVSGEVVRTVEAITIAQEQNCLNFAITANGQSTLANSPNKVITYSIPSLPRSPAVVTFRMSLLVMYLFGIHLAEVKNRINKLEAEKYRDKLKQTADQISVLIKKNEQKANQLADFLHENKYFTFLGHGPNLASALFSAAKITEAAGLIAVAQDTEEWSHLQYFETAFENIPTFLFSTGGRGYSRVIELINQMQRINRQIIAISPQNCEELQTAANFNLPVMEEVDELFAPIIYPINIELFTAYLAEKLGTGYYREDLATHPKGGNSIRTSKLLNRSQIQKND